jgi:nucleoside-diphosphate-sugar epimerase
MKITKESTLTFYSFFPLMHIMSKKLAIFGCGYLGSELARQALGLGWDVSAVTRNADTASSLSDSGVQKVVVAELGADSWKGEIDSTQDFVVNCVGAASPDLDGYLKSYVDGQDSVVKWARDGKVGTFVFTSSTSVYPQKERRLVDETASSDGVSEKGGLLLAAEQLGFPGGGGIGRSFILRLSGLYGPDRHLFLENVRNGETQSGDGDRILNLIHRDDAVTAVFAVLQAGEQNIGRIYNVSDGNPSSRAEIAVWLADKLGVDAPSFAGSDGSDTSNRKISNIRIRDELNWSPAFPSFREGYNSILEK